MSLTNKRGDENQTNLKMIFPKIVFRIILLTVLFLQMKAFEFPSLSTTEVFFLPFKETVFKSTDLVNQSNVKYRASIESMPDLPDWIQYVNADRGNGYLYGVPVRSEKINIEIIATNTNNYNTYRKVITLSVKEREKKAKYEVEIRFSNLNVEDMFQNSRIQKVKRIFRHWLWKEEVYVTLVASSVDMGGRLPLNPRDKDGVVIRVGSESNFSREIFNVEQEVIPLRKMQVPCPKDYKRTIAERFFRDEDFIPDWCGFRLHVHRPKPKKDSIPKVTPIHVIKDNFDPPSLYEPRRDLLPDFILTIVVPTTIAFILFIILSFFMCCYHEGIEKRNRDNPSIQMVQYASIHRASNTLRSMATKRDVPKSCGPTPTSTLHRSYGNTPTSTLAKPTNTKPNDEKELINRPPLPPLYIPPQMSQN